jgi:hypothetical protein
MAETVSGLQDAVVQEASFDVTSAQALAWLNRRWRLALRRARAYRDTVSFGVTVAGTAFYAAPAGVIELYSLEVAGVPYGRAKRPDGYANSMSRLRWSGQGETGLFYEDASASAVQGVTLIPTPTAAGLAVTGLAAASPPDLTADGTGDTLLNQFLDIGLDVETLIAGALSIGYSREGNVGLRDAQMGVFDRDVEEWRRVVRRRFRGPGPTDIRIAGRTA